MNLDSDPGTTRHAASFAPEWTGTFPPLQREEPKDICDIAFPIVLRGYSRDAVDAYVAYVNRVVYELRLNRSPRSAVRHALDQAGDQVTGLLHEARETADEILTAARAEADQIAEHAREEAFATSLRARAEADGIRCEALVEAERLREECRHDLDGLRARANQELDEQRSRLEAVHQERARALEAAHTLGARLQSLGEDRPAGELPLVQPEATPRPAELTDALHQERAKRARRAARTRRR